MVNAISLKKIVDKDIPAAKKEVFTLASSFGA